MPAKQDFLKFLSDSLAKQQIELMKEVTGDRNKPKVVTSSGKMSPEDTTFFITIWTANPSEYPIKDIQVTMNYLFKWKPSEEL